MAAPPIRRWSASTYRRLFLAAMASCYACAFGSWLVQVSRHQLTTTA